MNLAKTTIENPLLSSIALLIILVGGYFAYNNLARFEDPEFTIRIAKVITRYPGATPTEVMNEVSEPLEAAVQQLAEVDTVSSISSAGMSELTVEIKFEDSKTKSDLQIIWTKLRNKINDAQGDLPPGAERSIVNDEFGDVYGLYYTLTGEGYSPADLMNYAEELRRELLLVEGVAKIEITGDQDEAIFVEISRDRIASLGVSVNDVYDTLVAQNAVAPAGDMVLGDERITIRPTGEVSSVDAIGNLVVASGTGLTRIRHIANVTRAYQEPARFKARYNGEPALIIGVSNVTGANVVRLGEAIDQRLAEIEFERPIGMELHEVYHQGKVVDGAILDFVNNVIAALVIVFLTLFVFMGFRSGMIMGATVLMTMAATLLFMYFLDVPMHRISLGALVISLGMLVDNGVVVTDGMLVGVQAGKKKLDVAIDVTRRNMKPLLGGTLVGVIAFAPIGFAPGDTAEFTGHLFWVVMIALGLSWFFAFTLTPLLCFHVFKEETPKEQDKPKEENRFYRSYRTAIAWALSHKPIVLGLTVLIFATAMYGFTTVRQGFFPASTTPQVIVDYWLPEGTDIERTMEDMIRLEQYAMTVDGVESVQALAGANSLRYMLTYDTGTNNAAYGQLLMRTSDYNENDRILEIMQTYIDNEFPEGNGRAWKFILGPGGGAKIEASFQGPDPSVLRDLANQAKAIMVADPGALLIRDDWRRQVPVVQPVYSESKGERLGISREDLANTLQTNYSGRTLGVYREGDDLIPIISRAPENERIDPFSIASIQIVSETSGRVLPIMQVGDAIGMIWRDNRYLREDRILTIKAQADPRPGVYSDDLFQRLRPQIEAIELPAGYTLTWDGEYGDSTEAQSSLATTFPMAFLAMILVVIVLFNKLRQPLIIWSVVPLAIIGVVLGLRLTNTAMEFMGILGMLSLVGLLIQNSLVLVDHTDNLIAAGMARHDALIESAASRLRPVAMGAVTTVLGVIPLFFDAFFRSMTVVIMFGLSFATVITLFVTPVLYASLFGINRDESAQAT